MKEGMGYISDPFTFGLFHHELGHLKMYGHDNAVAGGTHAGDFIRQYLTDVTETDKYLYDYPDNPTEIYRTNVVGELDYKFVKNNAYKDKAVNSLYIPSLDTLYLFFHGGYKTIDFANNYESNLMPMSMAFSTFPVNKDLLFSFHINGKIVLVDEDEEAHVYDAQSLQAEASTNYWPIDGLYSYPTHIEAVTLADDKAFSLCHVYAAR